MCCFHPFPFHQINSSSSLISLGTLIIGVPSRVFLSISGNQLISASQTPSLVANLLSGPQIIQQVFVSQVWQVFCYSLSMIWTAHFHQLLRVKIESSPQRVNSQRFPSSLRSYQWTPATCKWSRTFPMTWPLRSLDPCWWTSPVATTLSPNSTERNGNGSR